MKLFLAAALCLAALPLAAQARIGETEAEIADRYGESVGEVPENVSANYIHAEKSRAYRKLGLIVVVAYLDGKSSGESYLKPGGESFTEAEITALMDANSSGRKWVLIGKYDTLWAYYRDDALVTSHYDPKTHVLDIATEELRGGKKPKPEKGF